MQDVVQKTRGHLTAVALFGSTLAGVVVDELENRVHPDTPTPFTPLCLLSPCSDPMQ